MVGGSIESIVTDRSVMRGMEGELRWVVTWRMAVRDAPDTMFVRTQHRRSQAMAFPDSAALIGCTHTRARMTDS